MATRSPLKKSARSGDAAHNITGECERLFCETLRAVFLVERDGGLENSLVMGAQHEARMGGHAGTVKSPGVNAGMPIRRMAPPVGTLPTPSPSPDGLVYAESAVLVREYMEVYDYHATGTCFRGFVAEKNGERAMFAFFDKDVIGQDLKPGLTSLLELASTDQLECSQLIVCIDRTADEEATKDLTKDLGWVGFEMTMLDAWSGQECTVSDRWLFLTMDT